MKIRLGFVSNSSASSYIIAWNPKDFEICDKCGRGSKDPINLLKESTYLQPSHTEIECASGEERIAYLTTQIEELKKSMEEASKRPAGDVYDTERFGDVAEAANNPFIEKVWRHMSFCNHRITMLERQIKIIRKKLGEGKQVLWAAVYYNDPCGKILQKMMEDKVVEQLKDL